jgi:hypothetical protein
VLSALNPVIVSPLSHHLDAGLVVLSGASIFAVVSYVGSRRVLAHGGGTTADAAPAAPDSVGR